MTSEAAKGEGGLSFGVVPEDNTHDAEPLLARLAGALSEALGVPVRGEIASGYDALARGLDEGSIAMGWLPPVPALRRLGKGEMVCVALPVRRGRMGYSAVLVAPRGSPHASAAALRGARVAWVDPDSAAGHLVVRARLLADGIDPDATFAEQRFAGSHGEVVRLLMRGEADVGATFASVEADGSIKSAGWTGIAEPGELTVVLLEGPLPADLIAAGRRLPPELLLPLRRSLVDPRSPVALAACALLHADRLDEPDEDHFDALQRLLERLRPWPPRASSLRTARHGEPRPFGRGRGRFCLVHAASGESLSISFCLADARSGYGPSCGGLPAYLPLPACGRGGPLEVFMQNPTSLKRAASPAGGLVLAMRTCGGGELRHAGGRTALPGPLPCRPVRLTLCRVPIVK